MPLLGSAAIAMWWDITPECALSSRIGTPTSTFRKIEYPGFPAGVALVRRDEGFFVMYELESYETLTSPHYLERLNDPTPWSTKMMPHHRNMVRSQCRIVASYGGGIAGSLLTVRLSPEPSQADTARSLVLEVLRQSAARSWPDRRPSFADRDAAIGSNQGAGDPRRQGCGCRLDRHCFRIRRGSPRKFGRRQIRIAGVKGAQHDVYRLSYAATARDLKLNH